MTDPDQPEQAPHVPEASPDLEPRFDEPSPPAPAVTDPPERSTEF